MKTPAATVVLAIVALVSLTTATYAGLPTAPYLNVAQDRGYIGIGFYRITEEGALTSVGMDSASADIVYFRIVRNNMPEVRDTKTGFLLPYVVEVRAVENGKEFYEYPLLWEIWDSKGNGKGDFLAVVRGTNADGTPQFQVLPIPEEDQPDMSKLGMFIPELPDEVET